MDLSFTRALRDLGVTHALLHGGDPGQLSRYSSYQHLGSVGDNHLFAVRWEEPRSDDPARSDREESIH